MTTTSTKLTIGTTYDLDTLTLAGWTGPHGGLSCWDYFDAAGRYLGPDQDGVEPLFDVVESFGDLMDYFTGDYLRPATRSERDASRAAGDEGVILVDGRRCYVQE